MKYLLIILLFPLNMLAQDGLQVKTVNNEKDFKSELTERKPKKVLKKAENGEMNVVLADERIQILDDYVKENPLTLTGFRIQLVFGNRTTVNNAKSKFYGRFSGTPLYESYLAPNFRLRVGDFFTRLQAEAFLNEVRAAFPNAYIVNDRINIPDYIKEN